MRKLGLASSDDAQQTGVRRARLPQRAADVPTIRVPLNPGAVDAPGSHPPTPMPPDSLVRRGAEPAPVPAYVTPPAPPFAPRHADRLPPADLGGVTEYHQVARTAGDLVGVLVGVAGPLKGQLYPVGDGDTRLGREACEITLRSKRISRYHAKIVHVEGAFVIEANPEVSSRNPTVLNDQTIDAEALSDGDVIRLGDCAFKFRTI